MKKEQVKELILNTITDLVVDFSYHDRKEDESLSENVLDESIKRGVITIDEISNHFKSKLEEVYKDVI